MKFQEHSVHNLLGPLNDVEEKHAPERLFTAGDTLILEQGSRVSIVGTRRPSERGTQYACALAEWVVSQGAVVVSGLALGIDTVAHTTAMDEGGRTIAVLGTPLDRVYPRENNQLQNRIAEKDLVISQFRLGEKTGRHSFPLRNRTMALIADATVIVEASEKSGTMHQGWEALRLGRPLFFADWLANDYQLEWVEKMQEYGAQILPEGGFDALKEFLPERGRALPSASSF